MQCFYFNKLELLARKNLNLYIRHYSKECVQMVKKVFALQFTRGISLGFSTSQSQLKVNVINWNNQYLRQFTAILITLPVSTGGFTPIAERYV